MKELQSLDDIFSKRIFRIPDYQRGYAWGDEQLEAFWDDVVNLPPKKSHYTGVLSIKEVEEPVWKQWNDEKWLLDNGNKAFHIVDGQQRLTTFVLLIQVIYEFLKKKKPDTEDKDIRLCDDSITLEEVREQYLVKSKPSHLIHTYRFGYDDSNDDGENHNSKYLKHEIFNKPDGGIIQETFYTANLKNAKDFFIKKFEAYYEVKKDFGIDNLFQKITQRLMFNVYEIKDETDVFIAFETMNNRGKQLSNLEKLKNRLIYLSTLYEKLSDDEQISLRKEINSAWKEVYRQLGKNKINRLNDDDFLFAHWIMYFPYTRKKGDDYKTFLLEKKFTTQSIYGVENYENPKFIEISDDDFDDEVSLNENDDLNSSVTSKEKLQPEEIQNYVHSLKSAVGHWYNTFNPNEDANQLLENERLWLDRLHRIGIACFRPLVTASFLSKNTDTESRVELFKAIERFIFIAFRLSRSPSNYKNSEFYTMARKLQLDEISSQNVIIKLEKIIKTEFSLSNSYIDHNAFQLFLRRKFRDNGGGFYDWNGLRYFLYEYEREKVIANGNPKINWKFFVKSEKDKVSIEHIFPQTPNNEYWKVKFDGFQKSELNFLQGTLGNLLPLSQSINSSLQNDSFPDKKLPKNNRRGYSQGSHSEIEVSQYADWNPQTILERGLKLLDFMEQRWDLKFESKDAKIKLLFLDFLPE